MGIKLVKDAKKVALKARSVHLLLLSFVFDGLEFGLPLVSDNLPIPPMTMLAMGVAVKIAALAFRFISQKEFRRGDED